MVHAFITHADGSITDLGVAHNLLTTVGRDLMAAAMGAAVLNNGTNVATATSATSLTDSGEAWTVDQFKGWVVIAEQGTDTPVLGNIGSNSATVLTIERVAQRGRLGRDDAGGHRQLRHRPRLPAALHGPDPERLGSLGRV